jgi:hypothetical protein
MVQCRCGIQLFRTSVTNAILRVAHSVVTGNSTGAAAPGSTLFSYGDNDIDGNTSDNTAILISLAIRPACLMRNAQGAVYPAELIPTPIITQSLGPSSVALSVRCGRSGVADSNAWMI